MRLHSKYDFESYLLAEHVASRIGALGVRAQLYTRIGCSRSMAR